MGLKGGDKVVLIKENGRVVMANVLMLALKEVQESFAEVAENMNLKDEYDVVELVKTYRKTMKAKV
jgi:hypothetical protein